MASPERSLTSARLLFFVGFLAFLLAVLSIVDMYLPRPWDGVVLESDVRETLTVREVARDSGAEEAGIRPSDRIIGIDRSIVRSNGHAAVLLNAQEIGDVVPYFIERAATGAREEVLVRLTPRQIGNLTYLLACLLGFAFFVVGVFVLVNRPDLRAARVFFLLCTLFLLFLVCRLRPASYSWVDAFVLTTGTQALVLLPGAFLHFFLLFPRPAFPILGHEALGGRGRRKALVLLAALYLTPVLVYASSLGRCYLTDTDLELISGAPRANWWMLAGSVAAGLAVLALNRRRLTTVAERRGAQWVFFGVLFGLVPFLVSAMLDPSSLYTRRFIIFGFGPLLLVPTTFAWAIVRFQLLDVRVILRKSLLYTLTTGVFTLLYAVGIASFTSLFQGSRWASSAYFPLFIALVIALGFEPLRRRLQGPLDRFFTAESSRLQEAIVEMGEALATQRDLSATVGELVQRLPLRLGLEFSALYLHRGGELERVAGPEHLPDRLADRATLRRILRHKRMILRTSELDTEALRISDAREIVVDLAAQRVAVIAGLASPRRWLGLVLLSDKSNQMTFEPQELDLLRGLLSQAAIGLETGLLLEERTHQAELERELAIAASIQQNLLPDRLCFAPGWDIEAVCRPARHVGGDFFAELPTGDAAARALVYGDVSGKSVPGALMMMAAQEALNSLAMIHHDPEVLLGLVNRRLRQIQRRGFVALGWLGVGNGGGSLRYTLAGQPPLLLRRLDGEVVELPLPRWRLPLGSMPESHHEVIEWEVAPGELIIACSDGVVEAQAPGGQAYGFERLAAAMAAAPAEPRAAAAAILADLDRFTQGSDPWDDVTLVVLARSEVHA